jgi:gluconolactonase
MEMELVTDDLRFPEGPVAMADGSVLVTEMFRKTITRVKPDGSKEIVAEVGGGPNGAAIGPDGALYICNNGEAIIMPDNWDEVGRMLIPENYRGGSIQRLDLATGQFTTLYDSCDGRPLNAPNDIVFDRSGGFWFTCFGFSDGENRRLGGIYYAKPDGSSITRVRGEQISPNGIGLSPDEGTLYWADSMLQRLWALELTDPGQAAPEAGHESGRVIVNMPGLQWFDSLAVEADGKICVATLFSGTVTIVEDPGGVIEQTGFPDPIVTNIVFGGADMRDAWATCSSTGRLYRCRWPRPGLKLAFNG